MLAHHEAGFTTWDLADHYGPAEDFIGEFRRRLRTSRGERSLSDIQAFTKWVPQLGEITRPIVERAVERSLQRMDVGTIDLLQFHWWDYGDSNYLDALSFLAELRDEGLIRHLALTNFDTEHLRIILEHGIRVVSNQVQYSLIDRRPEHQMAAYCLENDVQLLAYGTLAGGLLSERFLGSPEPDRSQLNTASLQKYKRMIDLWGGWELFQELLAVLQQVAHRAEASIANVAVRYVLDRPAVAGVIVGVRLGLSDNLAENARVFELSLSPSDVDAIDAVLSRGRDLLQLLGDCGDEYRR